MHGTNKEKFDYNGDNKIRTAVKDKILNPLQTMRILLELLSISVVGILLFEDVETFLD